MAGFDLRASSWTRFGLAMKAACDEGIDGELSGTGSDGGAAGGGGESPLLASLSVTSGSEARSVAAASLRDGGLGLVGR